MLMVAGDLTQPQLQALAEKYFGRWTGEAARSVPPKTEANLTRHIVIVDKPGSPQSTLRMGHVGLERRHPDHVPAAVMNEILGGLFSSRINLNLREVHGYTYGAGSRFSFRRGKGPFLISTMVRTDATAAAVKEVFSEIDKMRSTLPSAEELNTTIDNGATHSQIEFLAHAAGQLNDVRYRESVLRGVDYLLKAQYASGGWPQFFPDTSGYRKYITFNDGAMIGVYAPDRPGFPWGFVLPLCAAASYAAWSSCKTSANCAKSSARTSSTMPRAVPPATNWSRASAAPWYFCD